MFTIAVCFLIVSATGLTQMIALYTTLLDSYLGSDLAFFSLSGGSLKEEKLGSYLNSNLAISGG